MRVRAKFGGWVLAFALLALTSVAGQESESSLVVSSGELVPGSESPDKRLALFEVYHVATTGTEVCITDMGKTKILGYVDCNTKWGTDKAYKDFLTVVWDKSGESVAVHDSLERQSKVHVYRYDGKAFAEAKLPDIFWESLVLLKLKPEAVKSSGQMPMAWTTAGELVVEQRLALKDGSVVKKVVTVKPAMP